MTPNEALLLLGMGGMFMLNIMQMVIFLNWKEPAKATVTAKE